MDYNRLIQRHRGERNNHPHDLSQRLYRALSCLHLAESCENDIDGQFIFLWLAFNAAYAQDLTCLNVSETAAFSQFVTKICDCDHNQDLTKLVWDIYPISTELLLDNPYVLQPFLDQQNGHDNAINRQDKFHNAKPQVNTVLATQHTIKVIELVLLRLNKLRNQIIDGGATSKSNLNHSQLLEGVILLNKLVPIIINVMMDHPEALWGDANYPLVE